MVYFVINFNRKIKGWGGGEETEIIRVNILRFVWKLGDVIKRFSCNVGKRKNKNKR